MSPLFWQHPNGDPVTQPCGHLVQQHPSGDPITIPCSHLHTAHPEGHDVVTPCVHPTVMHPQGHDTKAPCLHTPIQLHANDYLYGKPFPCVHLGPPHPAGHTATIPCAHPALQHPGGDTTVAPCAHLSQQHPGGDTEMVLCTHMIQEHPDGHPAGIAPCVHWLQPVRQEFSGRLKLYFDDEALQQAVIDAYHRLKTLGLEVGLPRPLNVFNREPVPDGGDGNENPFWSHYNPLFHSIQLVRDGRSLGDTVETLHHEMGHAVLGHSIVNHYAGGPHSMLKKSTPTLAMSEGWAHFVALVIRTDDTRATSVRYKGQDWENMSLDKPSDAIEYCVGCCLWDLFDDAPEDSIDRGSRDADRVSLSFAQIFSVYSPNMEVLVDGVIIASIHEFLDRLKRYFPNEKELLNGIDEVRRRNIG